MSKYNDGKQIDDVNNQIDSLRDAFKKKSDLIQPWQVLIDNFKNLNNTRKKTSTEWGKHDKTIGARFDYDFISRCAYTPTFPNLYIPAAIMAMYQRTGFFSAISERKLWQCAKEGAKKFNAELNDVLESEEKLKKAKKDANKWFIALAVSAAASFGLGILFPPSLIISLPLTETCAFLGLLKHDMSDPTRFLEAITLRIMGRGTKGPYVAGQFKCLTLRMLNEYVARAKSSKIKEKLRKKLISNHNLVQSITEEMQLDRTVDLFEDLGLQFESDGSVKKI